MEKHQNLLASLSRNVPLESKLKIIHKAIAKRHSFLHRISMALYDEKVGTLKTFLASSGRDYPLEYYETSLQNAPSLQNVMRSAEPRVLNDLSFLANSEHEHTKDIVEQGYRASYTVPVYFAGTFAGFVFFDSYESNCFNETVLDDLDWVAELISAIVEQELALMRSLLVTLRSATESADTRSKRSLTELNRIARYSRIIASELGKTGKHPLTDADVEKIALLSPFQEADKLSSDASRRGADWIREFLHNLGADTLDAARIVENIARHHNEHVDGSGYPNGLKGEQIPIEARIVAVANMFEAMTSMGAYGQAWSNDEAFLMLQRLSNSVLDKDCVNALTGNRNKVEQAQTALMNSEAWISQ